MTTLFHRRYTAPVAAALFLVVPGRPDAWLHGIPLGMWPLALFAVAAFAWWGAARGAAIPDLSRPAIALAILAVAKLAVGAIAPETGWLGRYYPNDRFAG